MNTKKILFYSAAGVFLIAGGYLLYVKVVKPIIDKRKANRLDTPAAPTDISTGGSTGGTTGGTTGDKMKTKEQMKGEAISKGMFAYKFWDSYLGRWGYFSTGKKAEGGYAIKPDVEIYNVKPTSGLTQKEATRGLQEWVNTKGAKITEDGLFGLNTANAMVRYAKTIGVSGDGWALNDNQQSVAA
jgi:hypothetical protein